jgi:hypothetical protein
MKDLSKQWTLKELKRAQLDKALSNWLIAILPKGKPMTWPMMMGKVELYVMK